MEKLLFHTTCHLAACICVAVVRIHMEKWTTVSHIYSYAIVILLCISDDTEYIEQYDVNFFQKLIAKDNTVIGPKGLNLTPEQKEFIFGKSTTKPNVIPIDMTDKVTDFLTDQRKESENFRNNVHKKFNQLLKEFIILNESHYSWIAKRGDI